MVLAEEAGSESCVPGRKVLQKVESLSGKNVLNKVKLQLESLEKTITDVNNNVLKYV